MQQPASALAYVRGNTSGDWSNSAMWSPMGVPGVGDVVTLGTNVSTWLTSPVSVSSITLSRGALGGAITLDANAFSFAEGVLGLSGNGVTEGTLNVSGAASFSGASVQYLRYGQAVNLNGDTTWSAGNGRIDIDSGYAGNASTDPYRRSALNITAGATFTDAGAAAAAGAKTIGYSGGAVNNAGTYVRNGLGSTVANGLQNSGLIEIAEGTLKVDQSLVNAGDILVKAGARLSSSGQVMQIGGRIGGNGTVQTASDSVALVATGTIDPGEFGAAGMLTVQGDLSFTDLSTFHVDIASLASWDQLLITSDLLANGTIQVSVAPGLALNVGDAFTVARFGALSNASRYTRLALTGNGGAGYNMDVLYFADHIDLSVTAVPEPSRYALLLAGLAVLSAWRRRAAGRRS